jgi:nitroreductase
MKPKPNFEHPVHELIKKRWSPRAFSPTPVEQKTLLTLFEAARWAASSMNEQPWRFIYATMDQTERFNKLVSCLAEGNTVWAANAPVLILTLVKTHFEKSNEPNRWAFHDLGLAIGNLTTQASALDLYVHSMGGFNGNKVKELFSISAQYEPVTVIAVGYIGKPETLPDQLRKREIVVQQRKPLSELLF